MPVEASNLTADQIVDAIEYTPFEGASDGSIYGLVTKRGVETTREDVRGVCDSLVAQGRLELIAQKGPYKRYRVIGAD